jgi:predicted SnoaL-like aldol condensation-catalyzing enzyme
MIVLVDTNDSRAVRNKNNVFGFYDLVINQKKSEAVHRFMSPAYIQHNPLIANGPDALGKFFGQITKERAKARVVVHKIIAVGDYVFAHVNFLNLFNDDPKDTGIAGVDIYKMDADGKAIEHWDTLQFVGTPENSPPGSLRTCHAPIQTECSNCDKERFMTYSIIGSGAIGSALAGHFASKGIEVSLANNRGPGFAKRYRPQAGLEGKSGHPQRSRQCGHRDPGGSVSGGA